MLNYIYRRKILRYQGRKYIRNTDFKYFKFDEKPLIHISKNLANLKIKIKYVITYYLNYFKQKIKKKKFKYPERKSTLHIVKYNDE